MYMRNAPDAIILCGGAGTRLRTTIGEAPKSMARVAGRPFLEILMHQVQRNGLSKLILAVGYQQQVIRSHFGSHALSLDLLYAAESSPLGTGGAVRNGLPFITTADVLVMNGDSYTDVDLQAFVEEHRRTRADVTIVVVETEGRQDCGSVITDGHGKVVRFEEKQIVDVPKFMNAGIYMISYDLLKRIEPDKQVSLERELLPRWVEQGNSILTFACPGKCVDIGTAERFENAQELLAHSEN
jgi:NDP-sugar pyrophosphorylase family protein